MDNSKNRWSITVDRDLRPAYYDKFHCLAAGCRLSCCVGWNIPFNKKDYLSMKRQNASPELAERLERALRRVRDGRYGESIYAEFDMPDGVCPLLREDCLCALQAEKGPEALPLVCRTFPRREAYQPSGYLERSLSPACEGVLALLWELTEGVDFLSDPLPKEKWRALSPDGETGFCPYFADIRELCIDLLQDRRFPLPKRVWIMGMVLRELAEGEAGVPAWLARSRALAEGLASGGLPEEPEQDRLLAMFLSHNIQTLSVTNEGNQALKELREQLLEHCGVSMNENGRVFVSVHPYRAARERFERNFGDREYFFENLMVTLLYMLNFPDPASPEALWKSYVNFCNLYGFYRFVAVMSCREGSSGDREELFRSLVFASRALLHNSARRVGLRDELFQHGSATLAHMAVLLNG